MPRPPQEDSPDDEGEGDGSFEPTQPSRLDADDTEDAQGDDAASGGS